MQVLSTTSGGTSLRHGVSCGSRVSSCSSLLLSSQCERSLTLVNVVLVNFLQDMSEKLGVVVKWFLNPSKLHAGGMYNCAGIVLEITMAIIVAGTRSRGSSRESTHMNEWIPCNSSKITPERSAIYTILYKLIMTMRLIIKVPLLDRRS